MHQSCQILRKCYLDSSYLDSRFQHVAKTQRILKIFYFPLRPVAKFGQFPLWMMATLNIHFQAALPGEVLNPLGTQYPRMASVVTLQRIQTPMHSFLQISEFSLVSQKGNVLLLHLIYVSPATKHKDSSLTQRFFSKDPFYCTYQLGRKQERN